MSVFRRMFATSAAASAGERPGASRPIAECQAVTRPIPPPGAGRRIGIQSEVEGEGKKNSGGMTPRTRAGTPSRRISLPTTSGEAANADDQKEWERSATDWPIDDCRDSPLARRVGAAWSSGANERPSAGAVPNMSRRPSPRTPAEYERRPERSPGTTSVKECDPIQENEDDSRRIAATSSSFNPLERRAPAPAGLTVRTRISTTSCGER